MQVAAKTDEVFAALQVSLPTAKTRVIAKVVIACQAACEVRILAVI
jgi:hypothetical protein